MDKLKINPFLRFQKKVKNKNKVILNLNNEVNNSFSKNFLFKISKKKKNRVKIQKSFGGSDFYLFCFPEEHTSFPLESSSSKISLICFKKSVDELKKKRMKIVTRGLWSGSLLDLLQSSKMHS